MWWGAPAGLMSGPMMVKKMVLIPSASSGKNTFSMIGWKLGARSEEHTSELQSQSNLVCRLLLEKKKTTTNYYVFFNQTHITSTTLIVLLVRDSWTILIPYL